jgi:uncharacterized SAM-binding protein YcdF (DUF218 family)
MPMEHFWVRTTRAAGWVGLAVFAVATLTPITRWLHPRLLEPAGSGPCDAIVVLGASVSPDGVLDAASLRRAVAGTVAHRLGQAPTLVFLGPRRDTVVEAEIRAELARALGTPSGTYLTESRGLTTQQEAERSAQLLLPRAASRIALVTGEYHMWRAKRVFERAGFEVSALPVRELPVGSSRPGDRLEVLERQAVECAARGLYRLRGRL